MDRFYCILEDKECINCGECEMCDIDNEKICDSCGKCIESEADYRAIDVDEVVDGAITKE